MTSLIGRPEPRRCNNQLNLGPNDSDKAKIIITSGEVLKVRCVAFLGRDLGPSAVADRWPELRQPAVPANRISMSSPGSPTRCLEHRRSSRAKAGPVHAQSARA